MLLVAANGAPKEKPEDGAVEPVVALAAVLVVADEGTPKVKPEEGVVEPVAVAAPNANDDDMVAVDDEGAPKVKPTPVLLPVEVATANDGAAGGTGAWGLGASQQAHLAWPLSLFDTKHTPHFHASSPTPPAAEAKVR